MKLKLNLGSFEYLTLDIDPTSFTFYGCVEGYDLKDKKSHNSINFVLEDHTKSEEVLKEIKAKFNYNRKYVRVDEYVKLQSQFDDYVKDKRPRFSIIFDNGARGLRDAPSFSFAE